MILHNHHMANTAGTILFTIINDMCNSLAFVPILVCWR